MVLAQQVLLMVILHKSNGFGISKTHKVEGFGINDTYKHTICSQNFKRSSSWLIRQFIQKFILVYLGTLWSFLAPQSIRQLNPVTAVAHGLFRGSNLWIYAGWQAFYHRTNSDPWAAKTSDESIAPVTVRGCLSRHFSRPHHILGELT